MIITGFWPEMERNLVTMKEMTATSQDVRAVVRAMILLLSSLHLQDVFTRRAGADHEKDLSNLFEIINYLLNTTILKQQWSIKYH